MAFAIALAFGSGVRYDCMVVEHPHVRIHAYAYTHARARAKVSVSLLACVCVCVCVCGETGGSRSGSRLALGVDSGLGYRVEG